MTTGVKAAAVPSSSKALWTLWSGSKALTDVETMVWLLDPVIVILDP